MKRISLAALCLFVLVSCNKSDPYSGETTQEKPETYSEVKPAMGIAVDKVLNFEEGAEGRFPMAVSVPSGRAIVRWTGLPTNAIYDRAENMIIWTPSFTDANDVNDFSIKSREYPATVTLKSDTEPNVSVNTTIIFKVKDTPRSFIISAANEIAAIKEGEEMKVGDFTLDSQDFPSGPFTVNFKKGLPNVRLVETSNPLSWEVWAGPFSYNSIKVGAGNCPSEFNCALRFDDKVLAFTPDGRKAEVKLSFKVTDERKAVKISLPSSMEVNGDLGISFTALDPNEEIIPSVTIRSGPDVGIMELTNSIDPSASAFESRYNLSWSQIPADATGKSYDVKLRACNSKRGPTANLNNCSDYTVAIKVTQRTVVIPQVGRGNWNPSELKYLQAEKEFSHAVDISSTGGTRITSQSLIQSDPNDTIILVNGKLKITPRSSGFKFVTIVAVNSVGGTASETFMYEVLPTNWSGRVILGLAGTSLEFSAIETNLKDSNREFGAVHNDRTLIDRKHVFVGTQSLSLPNADKEVEFYSKNLKNVFISTPNLAALPANIVSELRTHGVYLAGRASAVPGFSLKDFELTVAKDLGAPTGVTNLAGATTSESIDPGLLSATIASDCTRLFSLFKAGPVPQELLLGVSCIRPNGGSLVVLGFEWADIRVSQPDADLPSQWFKKVVK